MIAMKRFIDKLFIFIIATFCNVSFADISAKQSYIDAITQLSSDCNISDYNSLTNSLTTIFSLDVPMIIEVMCQKWQEVIPTLQGRKNPDGTISAPPLEDMYPFLSREEFYDNMIVEALD